METNLAISVDLKKYRLRIHKKTLHILGMPSYVQLLINPVEMIIAICGAEEKTPEAHKVHLSQLNADNSFELYSKSFVNQLKAIVPNLDPGHSYRFYGKKVTNKNAVIFQMTSIEKITRNEVNTVNE